MTRPIAVLVGAPGAGKSTVGAALAERIGTDFLDTDAEIEARAGKSVGDIFIEDGEDAFRALERSAVADALARHPGVLALGGGAVLDEGTRALLAEHHVVYLQVEFRDAAKRVGLDQARPLLFGNPRARLQALLKERLPVYESVATVTVATSGYHPEEIVDEIVTTLGDRAGQRT
ncbi:shikimate kinase [Allonocardiopsis opalescens]|uniref:Shikimate kinase n=1 Tax=Allonocardiopsis opalescens TaxID=1144618 RepID=A0A2T0Q3T3_9ACTN|nr:shikimate kinase [Allonocardiopsis opalescens]PRX98464.1 shikimate kinase [Allonocardiopsis opalescens]